MDPKDLVIIDYSSLFKPPTPNPPIDSINSGTDDYFIELNQAWEMEVKHFNTFIDLLMKMERLQGINCIPSPRELMSTLKLGQSSLQTSHKV
jgi:hypothetical protein